MQKLNSKGQFVKGNVPWNMGRKHSEETRKRISAAKVGGTPWNRGVPRSEETKQKLSAANTGKPGFWKGKRLPEETKNKISATRIKRGIPGVWLGKKRAPFSEEWRRKLGSKGEKNHNWRGGITSENQRIRGSIDYTLWKEAVFERDNWTCQSCGKRGGDMNAHHILGFAKFPHLRFAINNGQTLCIKCHRKVNRKK